MSRVTTQTQSTGKPVSNMAMLPHDRIAQRAYDKWMKRGCQHGYAEQDWKEAEAELHAELARGTSGSSTTVRR